MSVAKKRWWILLASCLVNLCLGSIYAWSVFASPMAEHLSTVTGLTLTSGDLAIVYTVANSVGPITMISGGWFNDRFGPTKVILVGGLMFAAGMFLSGFAASIGFLIVTYGLLTGLGLGMTYGCTISSCVKYFPDKRGLIGGITTAVYGMGSVILPPIVTALVRMYDAAAAFRYIGIVFGVIITVCPQVPRRICAGGVAPAGLRRCPRRRHGLAADDAHTGVLYHDYSADLRCLQRYDDYLPGICGHHRHDRHDICGRRRRRIRSGIGQHRRAHCRRIPFR